MRPQWENAMSFIKRLTALYLVPLLLWGVPAHSAEEHTGHVLGGPPQSPVRIEVYSDFECPYCRDFYLTVIREILQNYSDKVCIVYHEFPLSAHRFSQEAARYSEAASRMGQQTLLRVDDALFLEQATWSQNGRIDPVIAKALSRVEFQKLKRTMQDPSISLEVEKERKQGLQARINSTPTIFIYYYGRQQKVDTSRGPITYRILKSFLDSVLKQ
jgi:protein-disulfide isomerase